MPSPKKDVFGLESAIRPGHAPPVSTFPGQNLDTYSDAIKTDHVPDTENETLQQRYNAGNKPMTNPRRHQAAQGETGQEAP